MSASNGFTSDAVQAAQARISKALPSNPSRGRQEVSVPGKSVPQKRVSKQIELSAKELQDAIEQLTEYVKSLGRDIEFREDEVSGKSVITVRDSQTKQVIRQIPSDEVLAIARHLAKGLEESRAGILLNGLA